MSSFDSVIPFFAKSVWILSQTQSEPAASKSAITSFFAYRSASASARPSFLAAQRPANRLRRAIALNFNSSSWANLFSKARSRSSNVVIAIPPVCPAPRPAQPERHLIIPRDNLRLQELSALGNSSLPSRRMRQSVVDDLLEGPIGCRGAAY